MNLVSSYQEMHDTTKAIDAMLRLIVYRPDLRPDVVRTLGQMNRPKLALPIVADMLRENPADPALLKQQWALLLADHQWKEALRVGEELVKVDMSAANSDYFTRSIAAALADSQPAFAAAIASQAVTRLPKDASLWALAAQAQRKAARFADAVTSARRALAATENGWPLLILSQIELGQVDSAIVSARQAVAAGISRTAISNILRLPLATTAKRANEAKSRAGWLELARLASVVDSIAPSPDAKYFLSVGSFYVGVDVLQNINPKNKCEEALLAEEMWATAAINAPQGAQAGPEQKQVAAQILTAIRQYDPQIAQAKKALCKGRRD
jgi:tetratricopeptide (TPR) repeat protein